MKYVLNVSMNFFRKKIKTRKNGRYGTIRRISVFVK